MMWMSSRRLGLQFVVLLSPDAWTTVECVHAVNFLAAAAAGSRNDEREATSEIMSNMENVSPGGTPPPTTLAGQVEVLFLEQLLPRLLGRAPRALAAVSQLGTCFRRLIPAETLERDRLEAVRIEAGIRGKRLRKFASDVPGEFRENRRIVRAALEQPNCMQLDWKNHVSDEVKKDVGVRILWWFARHRTLPSEVRVWATDVPQELKGFFPLVLAALSPRGSNYHKVVFTNSDWQRLDSRLKSDHPVLVKLAALRKGVVTDWERDVPEGLRKQAAVVVDCALTNPGMRFTREDWKKLDSQVTQNPFAVRAAIRTGLLTDWERDVPEGPLRSRVDIVKVALATPTMRFGVQDWQKLDTNAKWDAEVTKLIARSWEERLAKMLKTLFL